MLRLLVKPDRPDRKAFAPAIEALQSGSVVAFPTDTLYGLAVDPRNATAVQGLFDMKQRAPDRAIPLIAADYAQVVTEFGTLSPAADRLARAFWPGPLSLVMAAGSSLAPAVHGGTNHVAVRVPGHAVARMLASLMGCPLTASSANVSGLAPTKEPDAVATALGHSIAVLIDAGPCPGGQPSTIVDVTMSPPRLIRAGAVPWERVLRCLNEQ